MSLFRHTAPTYSPRAWAELKRRNGYRLTAAEKRMLGIR